MLFQGAAFPITPFQDAGLGAQQRSLGPGDLDGPATESGDAEAGATAGLKPWMWEQGMLCRLNE